MLGFGVLAGGLDSCLSFAEVVGVGLGNVQVLGQVSDVSDLSCCWALHPPSDSRKI